MPKFIAGVPPDDFTAEGQLWGNPVYDWEENKNQNFDKKFGDIISFFGKVKKEFDKIISNAQNKCKILGNQYKKRNESFFQIKTKVKESIEKLTYEAEKIKISIPFESVEDMPGYYWFNKRNFQIISEKTLKKSINNYIKKGINNDNRN